MALVAAAAAAAAVAAAVSGCSAAPPTDPSPGRSATPEAFSEGPPPPSATPAPAPTLDPSGTAQENREYFDWVNERLADDSGPPDGRAVIDSLSAAGFDRQAMEVTPDLTAVGLDADNVQFSVRIGDECLLGQFGNTGYVSHITEVLSTGRCLVGRTRPIDW